jgi:hypothetical protein
MYSIKVFFAVIFILFLGSAAFAEQPLEILFNDSSTMKLYDDPINIDVDGAVYGSTIRMWVMINDTSSVFGDHDCSFDTTLGTKNAIKNGAGSYVYYFDRHNLFGAEQVNFTSFNCTNNTYSFNVSFFFQENYTTYNTTFSDFSNVGLIWDQYSSVLFGGYTLFSGFFNKTSINIDIINLSDSSVNLATLLPNYTILIFSDAYSYKQMSAEQKNAVDENIRRGMDVWFGRINESDIVVNGNLSTLCGISSSLYGSGTKNHYLDAKFIPFGEMGNFSATTGRLFTINESAGSMGIVKVINNSKAIDTVVLNTYGNGTIMCEGYTISGGVSNNLDSYNIGPKAFVGFMNHVFLKHYGRSVLFKGPRYVSAHYDNPSNATSAPNTAQKNTVAALWTDFRIKTTFATIANPFNGSITNKDAFYWYVINNSANISLIPHGWLYDNNLHYNPNCESGDCPCDAGEFWGSNTTSGGRCLHTNDSYANISRNIVSVFSSVNMSRQGKYVVCGNGLLCSNAAVQMTQNGVIGGYCPIMKNYDDFNRSYDAASQTRTITEGYTSLSWLTRRAEDNFFAIANRFSNDDAGAYDVQKMQYYFMVGNLLTIFGHKEDYNSKNGLAYKGLNLTFQYLNRSTEPFCFLPGADLLDYGLSVRAAKINYNCTNLQGINVTGKNIQIQHVQWIMPHKNGKPWYAYTDTYANYSNTTGNQPTTIYGAGTFTFNFTENKTQMYDVVHVNYVDNGVDVKDVTWSNVTKQLNVNISGSGSNKRISFRIPENTFSEWQIVLNNEIVQSGTETGVIGYSIEQLDSDVNIILKQRSCSDGTFINTCVNNGTGDPPPTYCNATGEIELKCQVCGGCKCPDPETGFCYRCGGWGGCYKYKEGPRMKVIEPQI